jgi:DNA repair exonuclease SbcCD nuclease subunit
VEQIRTATRRALENLVALAREQEVAFVLLAGDIFDNHRRDFHTALFFSQCMGRLQDAGIPVYVISGNHDAANPIGKTLRPPENVHFFSAAKPETKCLEQHNTVIHGQSYPSRDTSEDLAAAYPPAVPGLLNIGLLHTALTGWSGHEPYAPTRPDVLSGKGYDYWALGHVHEQTIVARDPWIVFPGTIQGRHIRETGPKGCCLVEVEDGRVHNVLHAEIDVLRWYRGEIDCSQCTCDEDVRKAMREELKAARAAGDGRPVAVRLVCTGASPMHARLHDREGHFQEEWRTLAAELGDLWIEQIRIRTRSDAEPTAGLDPESPIGELIQCIGARELSSSCTKELEDLLAQLPSEVTDCEDGLNPKDPEQWRQMQEDVRELLLGRLLRQGGGA